MMLSIQNHLQPPWSGPLIIRAPAALTASAAEILVHFKQELKSEMESGINNLFLVGFNLLFINFKVYAWRTSFGSRT